MRSDGNALGFGFEGDHVVDECGQSAISYGPTEWIELRVVGVADLVVDSVAGDDGGQAAGAVRPGVLAADVGAPTARASPDPVLLHLADESVSVPSWHHVLIGRHLVKSAGYPREAMDVADVPLAHASSVAVGGGAVLDRIVGARGTEEKAEPMYVVASRSALDTRIQR